MCWTVSRTRTNERDRQTERALYAGTNQLATGQKRYAGTEILWRTVAVERAKIRTQENEYEYKVREEVAIQRREGKGI